MSVAYKKEEIYFSFGWYESIEFYTTCQPDKHVDWGKGRTWAFVYFAGHMSFATCYTSLHVGEIDATLLCSNALRYIWGDNEIRLCPDWMGWWHRYEIALVFPWLPCISQIDSYIFLSSGSFDLHWFRLIESLENKDKTSWVRNCLLYRDISDRRLLCFLLFLNDTQEMTETGCRFCRAAQCQREKKSQMAERTQFSYIISWHQWL